MLWLLSGPPGLPVGWLKLRYSVLCTAEPYLCFISFLYLDLYVFGDDAFIQCKLEVFHANQTSMYLDPHLK